ncbi:pyridoxamine 5'-phosphate oxidase family protein [Mariniphaga sp.]|uniref:pyridoxamine 5'-phosphate oxidase family protein n=1 Tax=Mariniphaga sp. TaxID=1954475 RepID=UPI0035618833
MDKTIRASQPYKNMNKQNTIKDYIGAVLKNSGFAVLATEGNGQPHTSLIAITPFKNFRQIIFVTYRNTLKYRNLSDNNKVAVLIEGEYLNMEGLKESVVLTIIGQTEEIIIAGNEAPYQAHLKRHPEMESFMLSQDCALFRVIAQSYQLVFGIDDVKWIAADKLDST